MSATIDRSDIAALLPEQTINDATDGDPRVLDAILAAADREARAALSGGMSEAEAASVSAAPGPYAALAHATSMLAVAALYRRRGIPDDSNPFAALAKTSLDILRDAAGEALERLAFQASEADDDDLALEDTEGLQA